MASKATFLNFSRMFSSGTQLSRPKSTATLVSLMDQLRSGKTLIFEPTLVQVLNLRVWLCYSELSASMKIYLCLGDKNKESELDNAMSKGENWNNNWALSIVPLRLSKAEIFGILGCDEPDFVDREPIGERFDCSWNLGESIDLSQDEVIPDVVCEVGGTVTEGVPTSGDEMLMDSPTRFDPISLVQRIDPVPSLDWDDDEPLVFRRAHLTKQATTPSPTQKHPKSVRKSTRKTPLSTRTPFTRSKGPAPVVQLPTNLGDDLPKSPPRKTPSKLKTSKAGSSKRKLAAHTQESSQEEIVDLTVKRGKKKLKLEDNVELLSREQYFSQRPLLRGKVINRLHFSSPPLEVFLHKLQQQGWLDCFLDRSLKCCESMVVEFYVNCCVEEGIIRSCVNGKTVEFDASQLGEWLGVPVSGFESYVKDEQLSDDAHAHFLELCHHYGHLDVGAKSENVPKSAMLPLHRLLYWFIIKCIVPRAQRRHEAEYMDLLLIEKIVSEEPVNLPALMIKHIQKIASMRKNHSLGYGFLLTSVFQKLGIKLGHWTTCGHNDEISKTTLMACGFESASSGLLGNMGITSDEAQRLKEENATLKEEVAVLKALNSTLKEQLDEAKALNAKYLDHLFSSLNRPPYSAP